MTPLRGAIRALALMALAAGIVAPVWAAPANAAAGDQTSPATPVTLQQMLAAAHAAVPSITPAQAKEMMRQGNNVIVLDVRETQEVQQSGKVAGAVHVPRGMLEFFADKNLPKDKTLIVYCVSGARAALAGKTLKDMGYARVYNLGGFKNWVSSGGAVEK